MCKKVYVQQYSKVVKKATSKPDSHVQGHKSTREVHFANWIVPPLSASNDSLGFHKVFPRWLPFVFPYSSAGSLPICPMLGCKKSKIIALMSNIQASKNPLSASNDSLGFHKVFPRCKYVISSRS